MNTVPTNTGRQHGPPTAAGEQYSMPTVAAMPPDDAARLTRLVTILAGR